MGLRTVKLRRLLGATALCGSMAIAATGIGAGIADAAPWGPPLPPPGPAAWGPPPPPMWVPPPAADVGTATSATASLYPVPSLLTDR
jgi:hypothetical protein